MIWFMYALLYSIIGLVIGVVYAILTGARGPSFMDIVSVSTLVGPMIAFVISSFRAVAVQERIPVARVVYHTAIIAFATPMLLFGVSMLADAVGIPFVAKSARWIGYWSIPVVFAAASFFGLRRLLRHHDRLRRASGAGGGPGGSPPSSGEGGTMATEAHRQAASKSPPGDGHTSQMVACFGSRGTPFRMVRRPT